MLTLSRTAACITAMINAWELFTCLPDEVKYLWSTNQRFSVMKTFYFFGRYYIFVLHGQQFFYGDVLENVEPSLRTGRRIAIWVIYKAAAIQTLVWGVDFALFKRVHLLFGGERKMFYMLLLLGIYRLSLDIYLSSRMYLAILKANYANIYSDISPLRTMAVFAFGESIIHIILALLIKKGDQLSKRERTPVRVRLLAHGIEPMVIWSLALIYPALYLCSIDASPGLFSIIATSLSVSGCRLILCMHRAFHQNKRTTFDHISESSSGDGEEDTLAE